MAAEEIEQLLRRGHTVRLLSTAGVSQAIQRGPGGQLIGVHDPRISGKAAGWMPELQSQTADAPREPRQ